MKIEIYLFLFKQFTAKGQLLHSTNVGYFMQGYFLVWSNFYIVFTDGDATLLQEEPVSLAARSSRRTCDPQAPAAPLEATADPHQN